jgi:cysteine-rich repeat protein
LDLADCQLSGTLPKLFHVQYLKLNNNFFTGLVPEIFIFQFIAARLPVFADVRLNRLDTDATRASHSGSSSSFIVDDTVITDFPQDVDECFLNISDCEYLCVDGWFPVPGYTCGCRSGYELDTVNKRNCTAVCGDGLLRYPEEECDYEYSLLGCYRNCTTKPGYRCDASGCSAICGDGIVMPPEECDHTGPGCSATTCRAVPGYTCSIESNSCQLCAQSWLPFVYPPNLLLFPNLRAVIGDDLSVFNFTSCISCTEGYALETRAILAANQCLNMSTQRSLPCSFACTNLTVFSSVEESVYTLRNELLRGGFITNLFRSLFNVNITLNTTTLPGNKKRTLVGETITESLEFNVAPCGVDKSGMIEVLKALTLDIVPNLPLPELRQTACGVELLSTEVRKEAYISTVIIVSVSMALLFTLAASVIYYYYRQSELHCLPDDISWSFIDQWTHPWRWEYYGSTKSGYHARTYTRGSEEYRRVESLLTTHFKKGPLEITQITAVYNRALSVSFVNQWKLTTTRRVESPEQFFHCTYSKDEQKINVMKYYQDNLLQFTPYNQTLQVPLLPVLHGTDYFIAEKIAQTGFASLSTLDPGFFGKGIYFTTSLPYTLPYSCGKRRPAVIISYINMGHIFPVTEDHKGPRTLKGQALKSGYNSHLALTGKEGFIYDELKDVVVCDEIVVNQESQILPAFLVELDIESCQTEYSKWLRDIPQPMNDAALQNHSTEIQTPLSATGSSTDRTLFSVISMDGMSFSLSLYFKNSYF